MHVRVQFFFCSISQERSICKMYNFHWKAWWAKKHWSWLIQIARPTDSDWVCVTVWVDGAPHCFVRLHTVVMTKCIVWLHFTWHGQNSWFCAAHDVLKLGLYRIWVFQYSAKYWIVHCSIRPNTNTNSCLLLTGKRKQTQVINVQDMHYPMLFSH